LRRDPFEETATGRGDGREIKDQNILSPCAVYIPCIFIVLLAPAILNIAKNMQSFK
jgi:hypothetical protein